MPQGLTSGLPVTHPELCRSPGNIREAEILSQLGERIRDSASTVNDLATIHVNRRRGFRGAGVNREVARGPSGNVPLVLSGREM